MSVLTDFGSPNRPAVAVDQEVNIAIILPLHGLFSLQGRNGKIAQYQLLVVVLTIYIVLETASSKVAPP